MNIAVNTRLLLAHRMEGVARYIFETTKKMVLSHPEVQFHFLFDRAYDDSFIFADNVTGHVLGPPARHPILWYLWFERSLPSFFKKHKIDAFYSGDMYMSLKANVPTLMISHDLNYLHYPSGLRWTHLKYYQHYMPRFHKEADSLITVSDATKKDVIDKYGIESSNIKVAHNSAPDGFKELELNQIQKLRNTFTKGAPYFVYVGSLHPRKNVDNLLMAFELFKQKNNSNYKLVIFGRNAWKTSSIFKIYDGMQFKDDVVFLKNEDVTVPEIMGASEGVCYVSLFEGFGIPILEAFSCGVPVITSNVSSMPEVAGDAAILVDPKNVESISQAMLTIYSNEELKKELVQKGKKQLKKFDWTKSAEIIFKELELLSVRSKN